MSPADYLASLSGLRRVRFLIAANKAGRTPLEHARFVADEQDRLDAVNYLLQNRSAQYAAIRRHAERHGRSFS